MTLPTEYGYMVIPSFIIYTDCTNQRLQYGSNKFQACAKQTVEFGIVRMHHARTVLLWDSGNHSTYSNSYDK